MPALTINTVPIPIRAGPIRRIDLTGRMPAFDGRVVSSRSGSAASVRVLPIEVEGLGNLTLAQARTLIEDLRAPGTVAVGGVLMGATTCRAVGLSWELDPVAESLRISCELWEVDANA